MGTQTMGSQGGVGDTSVPKPPSLSRQGSLYSLTLDEVQNQLGNLGKPLSSMNLDELLRNVWTVEANQAVGTSNVDNGAQNLGQGAPGPSLNRQSSLSLSRDLSRKTVDEVWREIQQGKKRNTEERDPERQNTLGEMTLEDFLVQAGVALDAPGASASANANTNTNTNSNTGHNNLVGVDPNAGPHPNVGPQAQWMQYQVLPQQQQNMMAMFMPGHPMPQPISVSGGAIADSSYPEAQIGVSSSPLMGTLSDTQMGGRKRGAPGDVVEKTVERRQKRMIKNRESAARSRARKQAYTHELENKVARLEEENERLRRMREVEKALPNVPPPQPKYQLRRTSSAPF